jgi:hypothetical protein
MGLAKTFVYVFVSLIHHVDDGWETKLSKHPKDHQERQ